MKKWIVAALAMVMASTAMAADLKSKRLDADLITQGLPLTQHQTIESGDGRVKQHWKIEGADWGSFEIIGDIQSDADLIGWHCAMYDEQGNSKSPVRDDSFCRKFFIQVLGNLINDPESVANNLLIRAKKFHPQASVWHYGDISIETDTRFYFIRRLSRM